MATTGRILHGIGVSAGTATGPAVHVRGAVEAPVDEPSSGDAEDALDAALDAVAAALQERAARAGTDAAAVLSATSMMALDPGLRTEAQTRMRDGAGPATALAGAVRTYAVQLERMGGYMAERVTDLHDVRDRATARLLGVAEPGVPRLERPSVLIARDLAPAETATLDAAMVLGIVTEVGGPTSHTAILAAQLGIPAVVRVDGATTVESGVTVALDGDAGEVIVDPTDEQSAELAERTARRVTMLASAHGPGATSDGHPVPLLANIGTVGDARAAAEGHAEGVGLFRTEFLFLGRDEQPSVEEQVGTYSEVFAAFGGRRVVVRTLDAGADKPLAFAQLGDEANPALGRRGLRLSRAIPELLTNQLDAIAAAAVRTGADVRVMAPMVATVEEARWFAEQVRAVGLPSAGVMIEVPAAALRAHHVLAEVDFASIGTNDLAQYALAADRMDGALAELLSPWQPGLLDLVRIACEGGRTADVPVGVCGEAGGDPALALVLVGLGVSSLSMASGRLSGVRAALAAHSRAQCANLAEVALAAPDAEQAWAGVLAAADPALARLT